MTIEEAREYWSDRLERASSYSDEHWDAEERHAHKDYVDALMCAIKALAVCRESIITNGDVIRHMSDEEMAEWITDGHEQCDFCACHTCDYASDCVKGVLQWLKKEAE